ncbi:MAG: hypothetical protein FDZ70_10980, partial [Actinobacteria bacterium]
CGELVERYGAMPRTARTLLDVAEVRALAAEAGAASVSVVRRRLAIAPLELPDELRGALATRGVVVMPRERKVLLPLGADDDPLEAARGLLGDILAGVPGA